MPGTTATLFSHVKPTDTAYQPGGLRDFFLYRDLGIAEATHGKVIAHLVKANMAPARGGLSNRHHGQGLGALHVRRPGDPGGGR